MLKRAKKLLFLSLAALLALPSLALAQTSGDAAPVPYTTPGSAPAAPAAQAPGQPANQPTATATSTSTTDANGQQDLKKTKLYTGPIEDPEMDCFAKPPPQEETERAKQTLGRPILSTKCLSQADSLTRAAEASSYMGHYLMNYSPTANTIRDDPVFQKRVKDGIQNCLVENNSKCDGDQQGAVFAAMMQYNMVREMRANQLINRTNAQNMAIMEARDDKGIVRSGFVDPIFKQDKRSKTPIDQEVVQRTARRGSTARTLPFMLDPDKVGKMVNLRAEEEREILGPRFLQEYRAFIDAYARSQPQNPNRSWNYVAAKTRAVSGDGMMDVIQYGRDNQPLLDPARERYDHQTIDSPNMQRLVKDFKDNAVKEVESTKDGHVKDGFRNATYFKAAGLGLPDKLSDDPKATPADIAYRMAVRINTDVHDAAEQNKAKNDAADALQAQANDQQSQWRQLSSAGSGPGSVAAQRDLKPRRAVSINVSEERFREFLNNIWPVPGGEKVGN